MKRSSGRTRRAFGPLPSIVEQDKPGADEHVSEYIESSRSRNVLTLHSPQLLRDRQSCLRWFQLSHRQARLDTHQRLYAVRLKPTADCT